MNSVRCRWIQLVALLFLGLVSSGPLGASRSGAGPSTLEALGPPPVPADNPITPEKVELGHMLFFDNRLSGNASLSCGGCHEPRWGWAGGSDLCRGYAGTSGWRNCPSVINAAYYPELFWGGAATSLEQQAPMAATGAVEGHGHPVVMEERLAQVPEYVDRFREVFGTERPRIGDAWRAIAAFERTLVQTDTPFDRFAQGETSALSSEARRGLEIFEGKGGCTQCHSGAFFTDGSYHNLGVPQNPRFEEDELVQITFRFLNGNADVPEEVRQSTRTDLGRYYVTGEDEDLGTFRTPTLRYLVWTAPYMHNGVFYTLQEVVEFYDGGGGSDAVQDSLGRSTRTQLLRPLGLAEGEKADLVAFLESLSGDEIRPPIPTLPLYGETP